MPIQIHEIRPEGLDAALAFASGCGASIRRECVAWTLSLLATDDERVVGAALCVSHGGHRRRVELCLEPDSPENPGQAGDTGDLRRTLVDKALLKLAARHVRAIDLRIHGGEEPTTFWQGARWSDPTTAERT